MQNGESIRRFLSVLTLAALLFGVAQAKAQDNTAVNITPTHAYIPAKVTGKIVSLGVLFPDPWIKIIDDKGNETVVMASPLTTDVLRDGKKVNLDFLKESQDVEVEFMDNGDKKIRIV